MAVANVTVRYVNPPKEGYTNGSIKTTEDEYISVAPDKLHLFEPGNSYRILYMTGKNGRSKIFQSLAGVDEPQRPISKPNGVTRPTGSSNDQAIFICACVPKYIEGLGQAGIGYPSRADIARWVSDTKFGYEDGMKATRVSGNELNPPPPLDDEIPY